VPEENNPSVREIFVQSYRLIYRIVEEGKEVHVVNFLHGAREMRG
jgi:plasmid stabilization system protein ParE